MYWVRGFELGAPPGPLPLTGGALSLRASLWPSSILPFFTVCSYGESKDVAMWDAGTETNQPYFANLQIGQQSSQPGVKGLGCVGPDNHDQGAPAGAWRPPIVGGVCQMVVSGYLTVAMNKRTLVA